ncbi:MAG: M56 family metallopeptidase [Phormidesmis sp.]
MMHVNMIGIAIAVALLIRLLSFQTQPATQPSLQNWQRRWAKALSVFVVPPLFLLMTAVAVIVMGRGGGHEWGGQLSYQISVGFVAIAGLLWLHLSWQAFSAQRSICQHPVKTIQTAFGPVVSHVINVPEAFSAQVGCWQPALVISQGLMTHLDNEHLAAVLAHEEGHAHYQDTFWFFWLGGLRRLTCWLPGTTELWQELLLLREIRADRWAGQRVDTLVLAESLMSVVSMPLKSSDRSSEAVWAGFSCPAAPSRLSQRVDALLANDTAVPEPISSRLIESHWVCMAWSLTPLLTIPFHR